MTNAKKNWKVLVVPYSHILSHLSRALLVAKELRKRGHEVVFAGESTKTKFMEQEGFSVLPLYEPDPEMLLGNIRKGKLRFVKNSEIEHMIDSDIALYKEVKPDLVVTDFRWTAPISTHIAGLRHVAIVNASSTEYRELPYVPFFEWIPTWLIGRETPHWKALDSLNLKLEMFIFDNIMNIFKKLSKKYGLKKTITATNCLTGKDITLLADIPEYFPTRNLPRDYHYIGPLTWESNLPPPSWWPPKKGSKALIYITMGTTGLGDFFGRTYELIKGSDLTAVITTGYQVDHIKTIDGKIYVESFIDGDLVMEECDLVVCHGGNGTICQALRHGKPVIGIATVPDQKYNMRRVEALGFGKSIRWSDFLGNPRLLVDAINSVLENPSFAKNAAMMRSIFQKYDAKKEGANIIESLLASP
ncbi:MAG: UDP glycosyltransferase [Proteobacteria bacterium]|nr:UDP glycosyltransferase [Pseudomonadota bacterium]